MPGRLWNGLNRKVKGLRFRVQVIEVKKVDLRP
jgi:hypothetical protein